MSQFYARDDVVTHLLTSEILGRFAAILESLLSLMDCWPGDKAKNRRPTRPDSVTVLNWPPWAYPCFDQKITALAELTGVILQNDAGGGFGGLFRG
jgi:hypothetical protein